jgi:hypothetical protein
MLRYFNKRFLQLITFTEIPDSASSKCVVVDVFDQPHA